MEGGWLEWGGGAGGDEEVAKLGTHTEYVNLLVGKFVKSCCK